MAKNTRSNTSSNAEAADVANAANASTQSENETTDRLSALENGFSDMKNQLSELIASFQGFAQKQDREMEYVKNEAARGINELHERENQTQDRELHLEDVEANLEQREALHEQHEAENFRQVDEKLLWLKDYMDKTDAAMTRLEYKLDNSTTGVNTAVQDSVDSKLRRYLPDADFSNINPEGAVTKQPFVSDNLIISGSKDEEALIKFMSLQSHFKGNLLEKRLWFFAARPYVREDLAHSYHAIPPAHQNWKGLATLLVNAHDWERVNGTKTLEKNRLTPQPGESVTQFIYKFRNISNATIPFRNSFVNDKISLIAILADSFGYITTPAKLHLIHSPDEFYATVISLFTSLKFTDTQKRYSTLERELLSIVTTLVRFKHLLGSETTVYSDHQSISLLQKATVEPAMRVKDSLNYSTFTVLPYFICQERTTTLLTFYHDIKSTEPHCTLMKNKFWIIQTSISNILCHNHKH